MGVFKSSKTFIYEPGDLSPVANDVVEALRLKGFEVGSERLISGGYDISITKGGVFKQVLGLKTALKIIILPQDDKIFAEASVGIFGQQVIPSLIMWFIAWPILITQIWGMVAQAKLDDMAMDIIESSLQRRESPSKKEHIKGSPAVGANINPDKIYCLECGVELPKKAKFCSGCGEKIIS